MRDHILESTPKFMMSSFSKKQARYWMGCFLLYWSVGPSDIVHKN